MKNKKTISNEFKMQIPSNSINEGFARKVFSDFIILLDPTLSELADIRTAVSEAVTNCIVHAYKEKCGTIYISGRYFSDRTVEIKIKDKGCGIENIEKAKEEILNQLEEIKKGNFEQSDIDNSLMSLDNALTAVGDVPSSYIGWYFGRFCEGDSASPEEIAEKNRNSIK